MQTLSDKIDQQLIECAWSLWTELGVNGTTQLHTDCMIALEELIVLTSVIAERDPRLHDEALDWCSRYHHFVSISRLKALVKALGESVSIPFSQFASTLNFYSKTNWPIFSSAKPLKFNPSGKSKAPNLERPALLNLRLRAIFGVGARADLFTFFLTKPNAAFTASDTAEICYSKRSLAELLDALSQSGLFQVCTKRNQLLYSFIKQDQMAKIIGSMPKAVPSWKNILEVYLPLRRTIQQVDSKSATIKAIELRNLLNKLENKLQKIDIAPPPFQADLDAYWNVFANWIIKTLRASLSL